MSDNRRRRRRDSNDADLGSEDDANSVKSAESDRDYESAAEAEANDDGDVDGNAQEKHEDEEQEKSNKDNDSTTQDEEGTGAKLTSKAKVDDDEDRKNPQFIPKRGMFYEHDDRLGDESDDAKEEEEEEEAKDAEGNPKSRAKTLPVEPPKRVWRADKVERWGHDKFAELDQAPKSKEELVNSYGYDIRNEDNAPRARRRRKYGGGPNKYTRNWEDEEAYASAGSPQISGGGRRGTRGGRGRGGPASQEHPQRRSEEENHNTGEDEEGDKVIPHSRSDRGVDSQIRGPRGGNRGSRGSVQGRGAVNREAGAEEDIRDNRDSPRGRGTPRGRGRGAPREQYDERTVASNSGSRTSKSQKVVDRVPLEHRRPKHTDDTSDSPVEKKLNSMRIVEGHIEGDTAPTSQLAGSKGTETVDENSEKGANKQSKRYSSQRAPKASASSSGGHSTPPQNVPTPPDQLPQQSLHSSNGYFPSSSGYHETSLYTAQTLDAGTPTSWVGGYPVNGPPPSSAFLTSATTCVPAPYINTPSNVMVNYGPPPVHYTPVTVPISLPMSMVPILAGHGGPALIATSAPPPMVLPTSQDQAILAAAAAAALAAAVGQAQPQGYAEVRGGVTYFNPTAQQVIPSPLANKRPKAAIPIVDPTQVAPDSPPANHKLEADEINSEGRKEGNETESTGKTTPEETKSELLIENN